MGNGSISFNLFLSTKKGCVNDVDNQYTNALIQSVYFIQIGNQIVLRNSNRTTTIVLTLSSNNIGTVTPVTFNGNYSTNIPNDIDQKI